VLKVVDIPCKGRGVVATRPFTKGEFVVEYAGDLVELGVAKQREMNYSTNQHVGCYMYYFQHRNKNYWYCIYFHSSPTLLQIMSS